MQSLEVQCGTCRGTGVYHGFAEPKGVGVVCGECDGTGAKTLKYEPFTGLKQRNDVETVRRSAGSLLPTGVGPTGGSVTYEEFLQGKRPE